MILSFKSLINICEKRMFINRVYCLKKYFKKNLKMYLVVNQFQVYVALMAIWLPYCDTITLTIVNSTYFWNFSSMSSLSTDHLDCKISQRIQILNKKRKFEELVWMRVNRIQMNKQCLLNAIFMKITIELRDVLKMKKVSKLKLIQFKRVHMWYV